MESLSIAFVFFAEADITTGILRQMKYRGYLHNTLVQ